MRIPSNLNQEHLLKAIQKIDQEGVPPNGHSSTYDVIYNGKLYPPKLIISLANFFANGEVLDRTSFRGGSDTEAFELLKSKGFKIVEKKDDYAEELLKFITQSKTEELGTSNYKKTYRGLKVKVSFGKGNQANVPWIAFLGPKDSVMEGIYPVYLFYKNKNIIILALGKSETKKSNRFWKLEKNTPTIATYFEKNNLGKPHRYGDSFVFKAYEASNLPPKQQLNQDLNEIIHVYKDQKNLQTKTTTEQIDFNFKKFKDDSKSAGLIFTKKLISRFIASLSTKPFVILTGLSGSGKTKLAQSFAQWICANKDQYRIVPVGADWTNKEPLLGYPNALDENDYINPENGVLELIKSSTKETHLPHFLILDEMNLSHVERYFAEFLSAMESQEEISLHNGTEEKNLIPPKISLPSNLFLIGTVNIDETTYMFSPKVLDRANTIEFRVSENELEDFFNDFQKLDLSVLSGQGANMAQSFLEISNNKKPEFSQNLQETLLLFFRELQKTGAEFGYRTASEISSLVYQLKVIDKELSEEEIIDIAIMQKLLPKIHGSRRKLTPILIILGSFCLWNNNIKIEKEVFENDNFDINSETVKYPLSLEKIKRMYKGVIDHGFASYAEA